MMGLVSNNYLLVFQSKYHLKEKLTFPYCPKEGDQKDNLYIRIRKINSMLDNFGAWKVNITLMFIDLSTEVIVSAKIGPLRASTMSLRLVKFYLTKNLI